MGSTKERNRCLSTEWKKFRRRNNEINNIHKMTCRRFSNKGAKGEGKFPCLPDIYRNLLKQLRVKSPMLLKLYNVAQCALKYYIFIFRYCKKLDIVNFNNTAALY